MEAHITGQTLCALFTPARTTQPLKPLHAAIQIPAVDQVHDLQSRGVQAEDQAVIMADTESQCVGSRPQRHDAYKGRRLTRSQPAQQHLSGTADMRRQSRQ